MVMVAFWYVEPYTLCFPRGALAPTHLCLEILRASIGLCPAMPMILPVCTCWTRTDYTSHFLSTLSFPLFSFPKSLPLYSLPALPAESPKITCVNCNCIGVTVFLSSPFFPSQDGAHLSSNLPACLCSLAPPNAHHLVGLCLNFNSLH